jgi:hypothetical protein
MSHKSWDILNVDEPNVQQLDEHSEVRKSECIATHGTFPWRGEGLMLNTYCKHKIASLCSSL